MALTGLLWFTVVGCSAGEEPTEGRPVAATASWELTAPVVEVRVPAGRLAVSIGETVTELDDTMVGTSAAESGASGEFVPVRVEHDPFAEVAFLPGLLGGDLKPTALTLVAGGERYELPAAYHVVDGRGSTGTGWDTYFVPVGSAAEVSIEVEYDGQVQTVRPDGTVDAGQAAGLYRLDGLPTPQECPVAAWVPGTDAACSVPAVLRTPYDPVEGWAAEGETWAVSSVGLQLRVDRADRTGPLVEPRRVRIEELRLAGEPPVRVLARRDSSTRSEQRALFRLTGDGSDDLTVSGIAVVDRGAVRGEEVSFSETLELAGLGER